MDSVIVDVEASNMNDNEEQQGIGSLSMKPYILVEGQEIEFGVDGGDYCSKHGEKDKSCVKGDT